MSPTSKKLSFSLAALAGASVLLTLLWLKTHEPELKIMSSSGALQVNSSNNSLNNLEQSGSDNSVAFSETTQNDASEIVFDELSDMSKQRNQKLQLAKLFNQAETALDAEKIAWEISIFETALADRLIMNLTDFCSLGDLEVYPEGLQTKNRAFCKEFQSSNDAGELSVLDMIESDPYLPMEVNFEHSLKNSNSKPKTEVFTQLILNSIFPEEVYVLMGINYRHNEETGAPLWQLGSEIRNENYPAANLLEAQTTALTLFQCSRFGGCGKNNYYTAMYCATTMGGACKAEDTLEQMLYSITRPVDFTLAQEILAQLFRNR